MAKRNADVAFTLDEMAGFLKIARSTAYKLAQEGKIPGQKIGKHWRFHRETLEEWLRCRPARTKRHR